MSSALLRKLQELMPDSETLCDDDELVMVVSRPAGHMAFVMSKCACIPAVPEKHWHAALYGTDATIKAIGLTADEALSHLHTRYLELKHVHTDARERSPEETTGQPGAEDVPDNHAGDGR